jgi:predicted acyl esterase
VNQWVRYDAWPPKDGFHEEKLYLTKGEGLSFAEPKEGGVAGSYVADPANPVPYRNRPIQPTYGEGSKWRTWLVEDQRFVSSRKDLANFETPVLDKDVTVTGDVMADIFAATTGSDADWALTPGKVTEFKWSLHGADHTFLKGHRMMVEVQSSWFPLYDRNPQTFVPNIMTAPASAYKAATQTIYGSEKYPSHLEFLTTGSRE